MNNVYTIKTIEVIVIHMTYNYVSFVKIYSIFLYIWALIVLRDGGMLLTP